MSVFTHQGEDYAINDANIADEFSTGASYSSEDHVTYQGKLYGFKKGHAAGSWNSSDVKQKMIGKEIGGINSALQYTSVSPELRNGSVGNHSNTDVVATDEIYPLYGGKIVILINKPVKSSGNYYVVRITTYSISSGITDVASQSYRIDSDIEMPRGSVVCFNNTNPNAKGFAFHIIEYNSSDSVVTDRITDYANGNVVFLCDNHLSNEKTEIPYIRNGSVGNSANAYAVAFDQIVPFGNSKSVSFILNKAPSAAGNYFLCRLTTYSISSGETNVASQQYRITQDKEIGTLGNSFDFDNSDGAVGFALSIHEYDSSGDQVVLRKGNIVSPDCYMVLKDTGIVRKKLTIGTGCMITKFSEGLEKAVRAGNCDLFVKPGTYDLVSELGEAGMLATPSSKGLQIGNGVNVYFDSGAYLVCNYTGDNTTLQTWFAPLMAMGSDYSLYNVNISCKNVRYCVHDECDGVGKYRHEYHNCHMYLDNSGTSWGPHQCIGGGFGEYGTVIVDGGVYESKDIDTYDNLVISYHNPQTGSNFCNTLIAKDVYIVVGTIAALQLGSSEKESIFNICGCSLTVEPTGGQPTGTGRFKMRKWNNEIRDT